MLRSFCLSLLGLALLAQTASAQTKPVKTTTKTKNTAARTVSNSTPAARKADPLRGTNDDGVGQSGYAAPGQPIETPGTSGKNTASYDGKPAQPAKSNTTLATPK